MVRRDLPRERLLLQCVGFMSRNAPAGTMRSGPQQHCLGTMFGARDIKRDCAFYLYLSVLSKRQFGKTPLTPIFL
jgi:hypothetical protein